MTNKTLCALAAALVGLALAATPAAAEFGLSPFETRFVEEDGGPARAGAHPFALETFFEINRHEEGSGEFFVDGGDIKDLFIEQIKGLTGDTTAVPRCTTLQFATLSGGFPACPDDTAVGITATILNDPVDITSIPAPVYNLTPPPGVPVRLGFVVSEVPVTIDVGIKSSPDYNALARVPNIPQPLVVFGAATELWGVPADPRHDFLRGRCGPEAFPDFSEPITPEGRLNYEEGIGGKCSSEAPEKPFLTLPRACGGPLATNYELDSWEEPGVWVRGADPTAAMSDCGSLEFLPHVSSEATTDSAASASGLDFELDFEDPVDHRGEGLIEPKGRAQSDMKKLRVTLPPGMTVNPSLAEGVGVCTPADLDRETLAAEAGDGCPNSSKIGTLSVQTPIVEEEIEGSVFLAPPDDPATAVHGAENPFDSLIAFYVVLRNANLGVLVKVPAKVEPDPATGQLITTVDDSPQLPFTRLRFHFREGQRAPLISPPACGAYETTAEITPWARPEEVLTETAQFQITRGPGGGPCPPGGAQPFHPGFDAGTLNNAAGRYSPFVMRLSRADGEQDMTKFSFVLPPGVIGRIAGIPYCPEAAIAAAKAKTGLAERAAPSCPAASSIGHTVAGAGVGSQLAYVPGTLYLAGPYHGDPLSVVSITPAVAGPFDAGTVVVREAVAINPLSAEIEIDGANSDPIPHILKGIPLSLRDLQVSADRPQFTSNATNCEPLLARSTLWGGGSIFQPASESSAALRARYQAADCARLGFKPKLAIDLNGGTQRGSHPALKAVVTPRPGDANFARAVVTLPHSAFLDQAHIRTICTRVQFAAGAGNGAQCPEGAQYGFARAWTPVLDEPAEGPVFLRSSDHNLPDLVVALQGPPSAAAHVNLAARIDSLHGGIRTRFEAVPDFPVSRFVLEMQGGNKGLIVNSTDLCGGSHRATAELTGQNGRVDRARPLVRATACAKQRRRKSHRRRG